jgi:hypothetical protein
MKRDTEFLSELNLMDYSFLVGTCSRLSLSLSLSLSLLMVVAVGTPPAPEDVTIHIPSFLGEGEGAVIVKMNAPDGSDRTDTFSVTDESGTVHR